MILFNYFLIFYSFSFRPKEKDAKEVHKSLKVAAGLFKFVQEDITNKLIKSDSNKFHPFSDFTDSILSTYINQCKAEAQESNLNDSVLIYSRFFLCFIKFFSLSLFAFSYNRKSHRVKAFAQLDLLNSAIDFSIIPSGW